ncbi:MAG: PqqD family protein [Terracidiphilus sp.]|jgi:hypothetical protein
MSSTKQLVYSSDRITWSGKQLASEVGGEVVLMNFELGRYYSLDDIGSEIWRTLEQPVSVGSLCKSLAVKYRCDLETVTADVLVLLNQLLEQELVTVVEG